MVSWMADLVFQVNRKYDCRSVASRYALTSPFEITVDFHLTPAKILSIATESSVVLGLWPVRSLPIQWWLIVTYWWNSSRYKRRKGIWRRNASDASFCFRNYFRQAGQWAIQWNWTQLETSFLSGTNHFKWCWQYQLQSTCSRYFRSEQCNERSTSGRLHGTTNCKRLRCYWQLQTTVLFK